VLQDAKTVAWQDLAVECLHNQSKSDGPMPPDLQLHLLLMSAWGQILHKNTSYCSSPLSSANLGLPLWAMFGVSGCISSYAAGHHSPKPTYKVGLDDFNNRDLDRATGPTNMVREKHVILLRASVCEERMHVSEGGVSHLYNIFVPTPNFSKQPNLIFVVLLAGTPLCDQVGSQSMVRTYSALFRLFLPLTAYLRYKVT
jgi:hypothetical protein